MKRIEEYTKQLHTSVSNYWMQKASLWITQLCGKSGMGKTFLAQSYLEAYGGQYFSFRNLDAAFAPQIFRPECKLWREFFAEIGETKNRPVIFFDDVDDRNDKEEFLNALPELAGKAYVVLIVRNQMSLSFPSDILQMTAVTVPMLLAENKALDPLDALRTIAITDGIPELVRLFDFQMSQAEFIRQAITGAAIRPIITVSPVNDELLAAVGKLTAEYGRIGGNLNQIARTLNEWHSPYPQLAGEIRAAVSDLAALKFEVLQKVGDAVGNIQTYQL